MIIEKMKIVRLLVVAIQRTTLVLLNFVINSNSAYNSLLQMLLLEKNRVEKLGSTGCTLPEHPRFSPGTPKASKMFG